MAEKRKLPCIDCICVPVCKGKEVKMIFNQCKLIEKHCADYIDESFTISVGVDMVTLVDTINKTLNRYFVPCFTKEQLNAIGIADCDLDFEKDFSEDTAAKIKRTYSIYLDVFKIDLLEVPKTRKFLSSIVGEEANGE